MQVELLGGPLDGKVLGVPDDTRSVLYFPYMEEPLYMQWTAGKELSPQEVKLKKYEYEWTESISDKGYQRYRYVKGT